MPGKRWVTVLQHIVLWLFILALPYLMQYNYGFRFRFYGPPHHFIYRDIGAKLIWIVVFYLNAYVLTPRYVYKKKYFRYGLLVLMMLVVIVGFNHLIMNRGFNVTYRMPEYRMEDSLSGKPIRVRHFRSADGNFAVAERVPEATLTPAFSQDHNQPSVPALPDSSRSGHMQYATPVIPALPIIGTGPAWTAGFLASAVFNLAPYFLTLAASLAFRMMRDKTRAEALAQEKQQESLKTELSFLRSQISPHFMFNVLNNINALARLKSDELEPTIIKLSSLMRYMLYETNVEKVPLRSEVVYLRSYIDLQLQRFGSKVKVKVTLEEEGLEGFEIEPMLLVPFVENAFKHGVGRIDNPEINIHLYTRDRVLFFTAANRYEEDAGELKDKSSGIGLSNVRRRLNLLYEKDHILTIERELDARGQRWFAIYLKINLH